MGKAMTRSLFPFGPVWDEFFGTGLNVLQDKATSLRPAIDVEETADALQITVEVPGLEKDAVDVSLEDGQLTISGEKKETSERDEANYHVRERRYGRFQRTLTLPSSVDTTKADARYENGLLVITLPKSDEVKPRRLEVK